MYKVKEEFLDRWFIGKDRKIPMRANSPQSDLEYIFEHQPQEYVVKVAEKKPTTKRQTKKTIKKDK